MKIVLLNKTCQYHKRVLATELLQQANPTEKSHRLIVEGSSGLGCENQSSLLLSMLLQLYHFTQLQGDFLPCLAHWVCLK